MKRFFAALCIMLSACLSGCEESEQAALARINARQKYERANCTCKHLSMGVKLSMQGVPGQYEGSRSAKYEWEPSGHLFKATTASGSVFYSQRKVHEDQLTTTEGKRVRFLETYTVEDIDVPFTQDATYQESKEYHDGIRAAYLESVKTCPIHKDNQETY